MDKSIKRTSDFLKTIRAHGRYSFTIDELISGVGKPVKNIRKDLDRLTEKGEIINIRRGFYTILPPEYLNMRVIPVDYSIDELMKYISKKYYVSLFSAAMFHGAAHQQPQEFYIIIQSPKPRNIHNDNFLINFSEKRNFPQYGIEDKKTETGYLKISSIELTFLDLIYFERLMGGYSRVITILAELAESINLSGMIEVVKNYFPVSTFQRAGFISENILYNHKLARIFESKLLNMNLKTVLLKSSGIRNGVTNDKWKILINTEIESDL